jgi:hypothetical protein
MRYQPFEQPNLQPFKKSPLPESIQSSNHTNKYRILFYLIGYHITQDLQ